MFSKIVNALTGHGIEVDTIIEDRYRNVVPGGVVRGIVTIRGDLEKVDGVTVSLVTHCIVESGDSKVWGAFELASGPVTLNGTGELHFAIEVPYFAPLSIGRTYTELKTQVSVPWAFDPKDADRISIGPDPIQAAVFRAIEHLGCRPKEEEAECEYSISNGFVQEFDYTPPNGIGGIEEVEISFGHGNGAARRVSVTVDNRGGFFTEGHERKQVVIFSADHARTPAAAMAPSLMHAIQRLAY